MARIIMHADMDAFYASCEIRGNPELRGKPIVIGADPQEGKGRGVVMACSYEGRALGLRSAMPISIAYRKAPGAVYLDPNYELYARISENVMDLFRSHADVFEQTSIDEAFMDVTSTAHDFDGAERLARLIKSELTEREGLTCSIGVAPNKSTAKIASDFRKPDGLTVVRPGEVAAFLAPLPVARISGVGKKTEDVLKKMGIETIGQLAATPGMDLKRAFGKTAVWLWGIARGIEELPVSPRGESKSVSAERTFGSDVGEFDTVLRTVEPLIDEVHSRTVRQGFAFKSVSVKIRFEGFLTYTRVRTLQNFVKDRDVMSKVAGELLEEFRGSGRKVRLVGVRLSDFRKERGTQSKLAVSE